MTESKMILDIAPLAVLVCNPTSLHVSSLKEAVEVGAHIFMEKPLIHTKQGLDEAIKLLQGYDKVFFIGFMMRYHPLVQEIHKILNRGDFIC